MSGKKSVAVGVAVVLRLPAPGETGGQGLSMNGKKSVALGLRSGSGPRYRSLERGGGLFVRFGGHEVRGQDRGGDSFVRLDGRATEAVRAGVHLARGPR